MTERGYKIRALGEIAIRCNNLPVMERFYRDIIGLEPYANREDGRILFFRIADGFAGHTMVLALFAAEGSPNTSPETCVAEHPSSLHHIALTVAAEEQAAVQAWYDSINQPYTVQEFAWTGWRGIFTKDPEGNTVEIVASVQGLPA